MRQVRVRNYVLNKPVIDIIYHIKELLHNGKLRDIRVGTDDIVVTCPVKAHSNGQEENPDCNVYIGNDTDLEYGFFHCFACSAKGSFTRFVAECFECTESIAEDWLIRNFGELADDSLQIDDDIDLCKKVTIKSKTLDASILDSLQPWTPYFAKRGISREVCQKFNLRYDANKRQVVFPVYDLHNNLRMIATRNIDNKIFYLDKNQEKEVYGLNEIQQNNIKRCLITEGPFDMLSGWTHNVPTIATLGVPSPYQLEQIGKSCIEYLYLAFDNDNAGRQFNQTFKSLLNKRILTEDFQIPKDKKDLNDLSVNDWQNLKNIYLFN